MKEDLLTYSSPNCISKLVRLFAEDGNRPGKTTWTTYLCGITWDLLMYSIKIMYPEKYLSNNRQIAFENIQAHEIGEIHQQTRVSSTRANVLHNSI